MKWWKQLLGKRDYDTQAASLLRHTKGTACSLHVWPGGKASVKRTSSGGFFSVEGLNQVHMVPGICQPEFSVLVPTGCGYSQEPVSKQEEMKLGRKELLLWLSTHFGLNFILRG